MPYETTSLKILISPEVGEVSGILMRPEAATHLLVLAHGAGADMRHASMEAIAENAAAVGIATLRYNFPFMEHKRGGVDRPATAVATVRAAVQKAGELAPGLPLLAGGHSFGGRMTTTAAAESPLPGVTGLVLCSFPLHPPDKPDTKRADHLRSVSIPRLFLSGTRDKLAYRDLLEPMVKDLGKRAPLHLLDTADHSYKILKKSRENPEDVFVEMARVLRQWAGKARR